MTLRDIFQAKYPENSKGGQCAAFAEKLVKFGPVGDSYSSKLTYFKKYGSTNLTDIQVGDVVLTDDSKINGHLFVVHTDLGDSIQITESNFKLDERVHYTRIVKKNSPRLKAHLRSKLLIPVMITANVTLYKSKVKKPEIVQAGIDYLNTKLSTATNNEFKLVSRVLDTDRHFDGLPIANGKCKVFPEQILELDSKGAKVTCLIHDEVVPKVTNPFHEPQIKNGSTPIQIPVDWFGDFKEPFAEFYLHELMHAWYYLIDHLPYDVQVSKVHNPPPNWGGYNNATDYYLSLLIELKPYWPKLAQGVMGDSMLIAHKKSNVNEKWLIEGGRRRGYADPTAYSKDIDGQQVVEIALDDAELTKIPQGQVIKS